MGTSGEPERTARPEPERTARPEPGPTARRDRKPRGWKGFLARFGELGPVWITAIGTLITALAGAGAFAVGRATNTPDAGPSASPVTTVTVSVPPTTSPPPIPAPTATTPSPTPSPMPPPTPNPDPTPTEPPDPPGPKEGTVLSRYDLDLPSGYVVPRFGTGPSRPVSSDASSTYDLWWSGLASSFSSPAYEIALLDKANPTYRDCSRDTRFEGFVEADQAGQTICFTGHGVVAAATLRSSVRHAYGPAPYVSLRVVVWQGGAT